MECKEMDKKTKAVVLSESEVGKKLSRGKKETA